MNYKKKKKENEDPIVLSIEDLESEVCKDTYGILEKTLTVNRLLKICNTCNIFASERNQVYCEHCGSELIDIKKGF